MDEGTYRALLEQWDGQAEYVMFGGAQYRVLTPNGKEQPVFIPTTEKSLYGSISTGLPQASGSKPKGRSG